MKYVPPYGRESEGDAAHYINGNPAEAREGSIPPAAVFENPQRELIAVIEKSKFTPIDTDLLQSRRQFAGRLIESAVTPLRIVIDEAHS